MSCLCSGGVRSLSSRGLFGADVYGVGRVMCVWRGRRHVETWCSLAWLGCPHPQRSPEGSDKTPFPDQGHIDTLVAE